MGWRPEHITDTDPEAKPEFDHSMTLGAAARTTETLIVWCRGPDCRHQNKADPADLARIFGPDLTVAEWRKRLVCSRCGCRDVAVLFMVHRRARH
jgi:hypothetical protein